MGDLPRGVPGGARGQLGFLQKHNIGPALVGEVVGDTAAHDAASDNDNPRGRGNGVGRSGHDRPPVGINGAR